MSDTSIIEISAIEFVEIESTISAEKEIIEITDSEIVEVVEGHYVINGQSTEFPKNIEFTQSIANATWLINHNLSKFPSVTIVDSSGREVDGQVTHINNRSLICEFTQPFSGRAFLN